MVNHSSLYLIFTDMFHVVGKERIWGMVVVVLEVIRLCIIRRWFFFFSPWSNHNHSMIILRLLYCIQVQPYIPPATGTSLTKWWTWDLECVQLSSVCAVCMKANLHKCFLRRNWKKGCHPALTRGWTSVSCSQCISG